MKSAFVMQPSYLPWIGIFKAIDLCDDFIFYDDVQFEKQSWQQRNKILNINDAGAPFIYLRVPVESHSLSTSVLDIKIRDPHFYQAHLEAIATMYRRAPYTKEMLGVLEAVYEKRFEKLFELNIALIKALAAYIGVETNFLQSEQLGVLGGRTERLVNICQYVGADTYLAAVGARKYLDTELFKQKGITVEVLEFAHPVYSQLKKGFLSHLSVVDALCHLGPQATHDMIRRLP